MTDTNPDCKRQRRIRFLLWDALVISVLAVYGVSYLVCGNDQKTDHGRVRDYNSHLIAMAFIPAAWVEAKLTRKTVTLRGVERRGVTPDGGNFVDFRWWTYEP